MASVASAAPTEEEVSLSWESLVTIDQDVEPYVLEWPDALGMDGAIEVTALVIMKRPEGVLLAVPTGMLPAEELLEANQNASGVLGPSTEVNVPTIILDGGSMGPTGEDAGVLILDCSSAVIPYMRAFKPFEFIVYGFDAALCSSRTSTAFESGKGVAGGHGSWQRPGLRRCGRGRDHRASRSVSRASATFTCENKKGGKSKSWSGATAAWRERQARREAKETYHNVTASFLGGPHATDPQPFDTVADSGSPSKRAGEPGSSPRVSCLPCLATTSFSCGEGTCFGAFGIDKGHPEPSKDSVPTEPWYLAYPCSISTSGDGGFSFGEAFVTTPSWRQPLGPSGASTESGFDELSVPDCAGHFRPNVGLGRGLIHWNKRIFGQGKTSSRTCCPKRKLLQLSLALNVEENATNTASRRHSPRAVSEGGQRDPLLGKIRRIWTSSRSRTNPMAGHADLRFPSSRKPPCSSRQHSIVGSDFGAGGVGQRKIRVGCSAMPSGRLACRHLPEPAVGPILEEPKLCTLGGSKMDHCGSGILERDGHDSVEEARAHRWTAKAAHGDSRRANSKNKARSQEERKGKGSASFKSGRDRGDLDQGGPTEKPNPLTESIDFDSWCICLPRWIFATRTPFSWSLLKSFSAMRCGRETMSTTVFPLPAPCLDQLAGSGPGLSKKRFAKLARGRLLHVIVMILDYLYLGRFPNDEELRRIPNATQVSIFDRLRNLIAVCGASREKFPLVPGRSGPKLAEALLHLESFVTSCSSLADGYTRVRDPKLYVEDPSLLPLDEYPQLVPHRDLDPSRLKIIGKGHWKMEDYLKDALWLPFVEPKFLLHGERVPRDLVPSFKYEDPSKNLQLAKLWDVNGMLVLFDEPLIPNHFCRVFQVYKNEERDRQIGDRRLPNLREYHLDGPSKHLPPGHLLTQLHVGRWKEKPLGSVTDRRDFYHQAAVTSSRARTNMLPFSYPVDAFDGTKALEGYYASKALPRTKKREETGDILGEKPLAAEDGGRLYPAFASLFQGDHLGVEYALSAHEKLLVDESLLHESERLLGHHRVPFGPRWTGLIIDDFFAIGAEKNTCKKADSFAFAALAQARHAYELHKLEGFPEKDIEAEDHFKAAGAEIDSRPITVRNGMCLVSAPLTKRIALSVLSLRTAALPSITPRLAARLSGNWVSVLLFRRCASAVVDDLFALGSGLERDDCPALVPLPKKVSTELSMLAALAPLLSTNVAAPFSSVVRVSDASITKGAIVRGNFGVDITRSLWQGTEKKGKYTMLESSLHSRLKELVGEFEAQEDYDAEDFNDRETVFRAPLLRFDFVEICGGAGVISSEACKLGLAVAPVLDLSESSAYDLRGLHFLEWILHMITTGRFRSFMIEPPCTTFSAAAYPSVRSYTNPLGYDRTDAKTLHGNTLAFRSFVLLRCGYRHRRPCGMEQPRRSKMAWLTFWRTLEELGFFTSVCASCQFGSIHKKEFMLLLYLVEDLTVKCPGGHEHVKIEGRWTKPSATYVQGLAKHTKTG